MKKTCFLVLGLLLVHCGSGDGLGGSVGKPVTVNLQIVNPNPNASGTAFVSKSLPSSSTVSQCTITATGPSSANTTVTVPTGAASFSASMTVSAGSGYSFCVSCLDSSGTTNGVSVGFDGCTNDVNVTGATSDAVSINASFLNLASRTSGDAKYCRISQNTNTQTQLTCGFNGALTDTQKSTTVCNVEIDTTGARSNPGVVSTGNSNGFVSGTKSGPYIVIGPGAGSPSCFEYDANGNLLLKLTGSWTTDSSGNTVAQCTLGVTQLKEIVVGRSGRFASVCSLTGSGSWVAIPSSGMADFDVSAAGNSDVASLTANGGSCSSGSTCSSGFCSTDGVCLSNTAKTLSGVVTNLVGPPQGNTSTGTTDGTGSAVRFDDPPCICITPDGTVGFVTDAGGTPGMGRTIRKVVIATQVVTTFAGTAGATATTDGVGAAARFQNPGHCAVDPSGINIYVVDDNTIRKIVIATAQVTTFAGSPTDVAGNSPSGTGSVAGTSALFDNPAEIAIDHTGTNLYFADANNAKIRKIVISSNTVTTLAGSGATGSHDDVGVLATFNLPTGLTIDSTDSNIYAAEEGNNLIRKITLPSAVVSTFAGSGVAVSTDGTGTGASFNTPATIAIDPTDTNLYVSDYNGEKIRKIVIASKVVTTLAGSGAAGDTNGTGSAATFNGPAVLSFDPTGTTLYLGEDNNNKIRQIQ